LDEAEQHRAIAGDLGNLLTALVALFRPLFKLRHNHRQQLHDNRRIDIGGDAHREHRELTERASRKKIEETEQIALVEELFDHGGVYARHGNMSTCAEDKKHRQREHDFLPELGNLDYIR